MSPENSVVDLSPYPRPALFSAREKEKACDALCKFLLRECGLIAAFSVSSAKKRALVRAGMNRRPPLPVPEDILALQDGLLWTESVERGIVGPEEIAQNEYGISLWEGDIARLRTDAVVNAANPGLLGCFRPGHNCIDNVIHSAAGMQLRADCNKIVSAMGHEEETGTAKITRGYNLPAKFVIHTVGPMVRSKLTERERADLRSSYVSCLNLAEELELSSIAFCCISTGVFNFPADAAAEIAAGAVLGWKMKHKNYALQVIFDTFMPRDTEIYQSILNMI